jgi:hypothetical protein
VRCFIGIFGNENQQKYGKPACCIIEKELTGFNFPSETTTFLTPQASPMIGWKRSKSSYEEIYIPDEPIGTPPQYCGNIPEESTD